MYVCIILSLILLFHKVKQVDFREKKFHPLSRLSRCHSLRSSLAGPQAALSRKSCDLPGSTVYTSPITSLSQYPVIFTYKNYFRKIFSEVLRLIRRKLYGMQYGGMAISRAWMPAVEYNMITPLHLQVLCAVSSSH